MTKPLEFARTFSVTVKTLAFIGIPSCLSRYPEAWSAAVKANRGLIVSFLSLAYCVLGQLVYFWTNIRLLEGEGMFLEFANQIACTRFCTVGLLKLFMLSYHRNLLAGMLAELAAWWNEKNKIPPERVQNLAQIRPTMNIVTVITIINVCMVSAFNLLPIAEMIVQGAQTGTWHRKLPYQIWFPWDSLTGWSYPLMYAFQIYSGLIVVIGNVGFDCIFYLIAAHLSVQLNYLNKSIEQLLDDNKLTVEKSTKNNLDVERFKSDLFELIELHQKLLDYKALLESIFSFTFFITFSGATIIICLQGIMIKTASSYVVAKYFMFFICILLEIYFLCNYGHVMLRNIINASWSYFSLLNALLKK
ncbi:odorant receptor 4 isoform X4 [Culex quinquefasciatus]|uniref:odorant receptor 4 isoform X4 n=1 Tax=Culex quinquefasciatus TaxID=7176 RepID=UPI0018E36954|nr:odorant receptor 4 isoform X4 [Culex quinquefasciatus]